MIEYFASCPAGLEGLLEKEIKELTGATSRVAHRGVNFTGTVADGYGMCLWSRFANRVVACIATAEVGGPEELYQAAADLVWEDHMTVSTSFAVDVKGVTGDIRHTHYAALKVKDAIVDRFRRIQGGRPNVAKERPDVVINVHLDKGVARFGLDFAGEGLHRRGYRQQGGLAPLKENVAAAMLTWADWGRIAAEGGSLVDPMCGSGTLLIEAAFIALDRAPGLCRDYFGFLGWLGHDSCVWERLLKEARSRVRPVQTLQDRFFGYDKDGRAVAAAHLNLRRAGLEVAIRVEQRDLSEAVRPVGMGLLAVNPPYGERVGEKEILPALYERLGMLLRREFLGWRAAVLCADAELGFRLGIRSERPRLLHNGAIPCRLLTFDVTPERFFEPHGAGDLTPALRVLRSLLRQARQRQEAGGKGAVEFANRLRKDLRHWGRWARHNEVDCYRLYDAELPDYALAIDVYQGDKTWLHVQEYAAPKQVDVDKAAERLGDALAAVIEVMQVSPDQVFLKVRQVQKGSSQYDKQAEGGRFHVVREGRCRFWVNFEDYLDTGLFLDHRTTRGMLGELARGGRFLNLFCYTGAATVHAALGGAVTTTSVDMSRSYLDWAARNLALNGIEGGCHRLIQADCLAWLQEAGSEQPGAYDLIFLDPPTFSNSKRMEGVLDVQRDHVALIRVAMKLLSAEGTLIFSTNRRRFQLDEAALGEYQVEEISRETVPADFHRNPRIHVCWKISHGAIAGRRRLT